MPTSPDPARDSAPTPRSPRPRVGLALSLALVVLLALNLRPVASSVGPVVVPLLEAYGVGEGAGGLLTALPCLCFGVFGLLAVPVARRVGLTGTLVISFALLSAGLLLRPLTGAFGPFLALSTLALVGPSFANVIAPAWIKRHGGSATVLLMTAYGMVLSAGAALAPALAVPLAGEGEAHWRDSLQAWGWLAVAPGILALIVLLRVGNDFPRADPALATDGDADGASASVSVSASDADAHADAATRPGSSRPRSRGREVSLLRSPAALWLTLMFGLQSMNAYTQFGYVPRILTDAGLAAGMAGTLTAVVAGWGVLGGLVMPTVIARSTRLHVWAIVFGLLTSAGYAGLALWPAAAPILWVTLLGIGGFAFPTAIAMIPARTRDPLVTARLSGMAQPVGYLLAGVGPLLLGALLSATGSMPLVLWLLAGSGAVLAVAGWRAGASGMIDDDLDRAARRGKIGA